MRSKNDEDYLGIDLYEDEPNGVFSSLMDTCPICPKCDYEGPLNLRKRGYTCPECRTLVLPV